jgi:hypothetical protein
MSDCPGDFETTLSRGFNRVLVVRGLGTNAPQLERIEPQVNGDAKDHVVERRQSDTRGRCAIR